MKVFIFIFALIFSGTAMSANKINVVGSGNDSCGTWIKNRKSSTEWHQAGQWINGYYVAAQELLGKNISLKQVDTYALMSFMDKYCEENPLSTIFDGTLPLLQALATKS